MPLQNFNHQFAGCFVEGNNKITKDVILETDNKLYFTKYIVKKISLILYGQTSNVRRFDSADRRRLFFWPTTFRAYIVRGVMAPNTGLQPYVAGRSVLEVFQGLWRPKLG